MSSEELEYLFKLDKTRNREGTDGEKGTGKGHILCKDCIEFLKSKIWAESSPGMGSTFSFTIPTAS